MATLYQPESSRRQVVDRLVHEYGSNIRGDPHADVPTSGTGFCGLEWQRRADGGRLVIAYAHSDHPGGA